MENSKAELMNRWKRKMSERYSGKGNPFYGKKHSLENLNKKRDGDIRVKISKKEHEILDGLLLSDGHIETGNELTGRLSFGFKYEEMCVYILEKLNTFSYSPINPSKSWDGWYSKSHTFEVLGKERKRWYPDKLKIVPRDIKLTPLCCYWWFIGDGYRSGKNVNFATMGFTEEDNLFLCEKLKDVGFDSAYMTKSNEVKLRVPDSIKFLNWIIPNDGILDVYKYKWKGII